MVGGQDGAGRGWLRATYREGCAHQAGGRHADAARAFAAAVAVAPDFADAVQNLGCSLHALERYAEAAQACASAVRLRPDAGGYFNLGMALLSGGEAEAAVDPLLRCVSLEPGQVRHHRALGRALEAAGRKADAAAALLAAVERHGSDAGLMVHLAEVLSGLGRHEPALEAARAAVRLAPSDAAAQGYLASSLQRMGQSRAALAPARAALRLHPAHAQAAVVLSAVLFSLGDYPGALEAARRAGRLAPLLADAKANEALALEGLGRLEEAEAAGRAALVLAPQSVEARYNLASLLLTSGRLTAEAWELYEARFGLNEAARRIAQARRWRGEDVSGRTVLLHCEQGLGDTIQFARYAPLLAGRCGRVVLVVQTALVRLFAGMAGVDAVVDAAGPLPPYDVFCPLLSLPGILGTTLETIPPVLPLPCRPGAAGRSGLQVGLAWAGSAGFSHDAARSIPLEVLAALASVPGAVFHSLQWPPQSLAGFPAVDGMAAVADMADTAAVIAGLDLVICVDTAVAHLAATMGKPVWLLSRFNGCWRWLRDRADSPWYPTMRIYRQARPNDWVSVVSRVRDDLVRHAGGGAVPAVRRGSALATLALPASAPRTVLVFAGPGGATPAGLDLLRARGLHGHVVDVAVPGWDADLDGHLRRGVLMAYGPAGAGARLLHPEGGLVWDRMQVPFVSVHEGAVGLPAGHCVRSRWVANGYVSAEGLAVQRRFIRSPQLSATIAPGVAANPARDAVRWAERRHRMVLVEDGRDPALLRAGWDALPQRLRGIVSEAALGGGGEGVVERVERCAVAAGLGLQGRADLLFGLAGMVDGYLRACRADALARAVLDLPVDIVGDGWSYLAALPGRARFHAAIGAVPALLADTQCLLTSSGLERDVLEGFAAGACVVTGADAGVRARCGALPSLVPVDLVSEGLRDRVAALWDGFAVYDTGPAAAVADRFGLDAQLRDVIELGLAVAGAEAFAPFSVEAG